MGSPPKHERWTRAFDRLTRPGTTSWLILAGVMLVAFVVRVDQALSLPTPQLLCDEFIYAGLASSFAEEGRLLFRGEPLHLSFLYPVLIAPAWLADRMETTYELAKTINVALMTASAVPLYLLGRRVVTPGWALLAPVLTLLLPMTLLSGLLMTESAFLPAFLLSLYAIALTLERPTWVRQGFVLLTVGLATAVRLQGLVLVAVLATAIVLAVVFELTAARPSDRLRFFWERLRPFWPTAALITAGAVFYLAGGGLGAYEDVARAEYSLTEAWRMTKLHLADLALVCGFVPLSALILLSLRAFVGDTGTQSERAFIAVATAATPWLLVQAGLFASRFTSGGVAERYVFYVMPVLFVALALWLAQGLPRPLLTTAIAAIAPGAIVLTQPLMSALSPALLPSSLGLFSFYRLSTSLEGGVEELIWLLRVGAVAGAVAFGLLWRPAARFAIPLGLAAFFLLSNHPVTGQLRYFAIATSREPAINPNREWIRTQVGDNEVGYLFTAAPDAFSSSRTTLSVGFWNPSVGPVVHLGEPEICSVLPARAGRIEGATGRIVVEGGGSLPRYLVVPVGLDLAGSAIATQGPLVLYRTAAPASLRLSVDGVHADRWMGADASYTRYTGGPGKVTIDLSRQIYTADAVPSMVQITAGRLVVAEDATRRVGAPRTTQRGVLRPGERRVFSVSARKLPVHVTVHIEPTFSALPFGGGDQRQLGAQVQFGFEPSGS